MMRVAWQENVLARRVVFVSFLAALAASGAVAQPDLILENLSVTPEPSMLGTELTASIGARNAGDAAASTFHLDFWEHRATEPTSRAGADESWYVPSLSGGGTLTASHTFTPSATGLYAAWAWVDSSDAVAEANEDDNKARDTYAVNEEGQLADLNLYFCRVMPRYSTLGEELTGRVAVRNDGDGHAGDFRLDFWKCLSITPVPPMYGDPQWWIPGLSPGAVAQREFTFTPIFQGDCWAWAWADSTEVVPETSETNNKRRDTYAVNEEGEQPDLEIDSFEVEPEGSTLGTQVTATAVIHNTGPGHAAQFGVSFWQHRPTSPPDTSDRDRLDTVTSLGAYTSVERQYSFMPSTAGTFHAWVWVDSNGDVPESDETDNKATDVYYVASAPDLVIDLLSITPDPPLLGTEITLTVRERNLGPADAAGHVLAAWRHRSTEPSPTSRGDYEWAVIGLGPDDTATRTAAFTPGFPGARTAWAHADSQNALSEVSETNNTASCPYTVADNPDLPDLRFTLMAVYPQNSTLGQELQGDVHFRNGGNMAAGPFRIAFWRHRPAAPVFGTSGDVNWDIPGLDADAVMSRRAVFTPNYPGTRRAWAVLDSDRDVLETNEGNNIQSCQYSIHRELPDLRISSVTVTPTPSALGQELTAEVQAHNAGTADAGAFRIALWRHRPAPPVIPANGEVNWDIAGLAAGAVVARSTAFTPGHPGVRTAWATADAQQAVVESLETNNVGSCSYTITREGLPDLIVSELTVTPNPSTLGTVLTYMATLENIGAAVADPFSVDLWYHRTSPPVAGSAGWSHRWAIVAGLPAGASTVRGNASTPSYPGSRTAWAYADSLKAVAESSEANNTASASYTINPVNGSGAGRPTRPRLE